MKSARNPMSDHQDTNHFTYSHSWAGIESMLDRAERKMNTWISVFYEAERRSDKKIMKDAARNKKALEGVIKTLRWVLGDIRIEDPLN